ncbi:Glycine-rich family protein [Forsythia ovata]|uniref:Glycine-rich family protein n=1 Tax=Forsythia ovata TaxID=205694 RepID=A0ABD1V0S9_9LAMI
MGLMEMQLKVRNPKELKRPSGQPFVEFDSFAFDAPFQRKYKIQLDEFGMKKKSAVVKTYWMSYLGSRMHCTTYAEGKKKDNDLLPPVGRKSSGQEILAHMLTYQHVGKKLLPTEGSRSGLLERNMKMEGGKDLFFGFGNPFDGFGGQRSQMSSFFGGNDPFDDPFFSRPFGNIIRVR